MRQSSNISTRGQWRCLVWCTGESNGNMWWSDAVTEAAGSFIVHVGRLMDLACSTEGWKCLGIRRRLSLTFAWLKICIAIISRAWMQCFGTNKRRIDDRRL